MPADADGPVFAEPWQAVAFALALNLHDAGRMTWTEWAQSLGAVLAETAARGEPDDGTRYYHHLLVALERIAVTKHLVADIELEGRKHAWETAYISTPHGQSVELPSVQKPDGGDVEQRC